LLSYHNVYFLSQIMEEIRKAIEEGRFMDYYQEFLEKYKI
jgi:queuine tRNA-ribosyltransferase